MCLKLGFVQQFGVVMKVADYRALIANSESAVQFAVRIAYAILCSIFIIDDKTMSGFAVAFKFENIILEYLDAVLVSRSDELVHGICVHTAFSPEYALIDYRKVALAEEYAAVYSYAGQRFAVHVYSRALAAGLISE